MAKMFSKKYPTYAEWAAQAKDTSYTARIKRLHSQYPKASLSQLRGHPKKKEAPLKEVKRKPVSQLGWDELTPDEQYLRRRAHSVFSRMKGQVHFPGDRVYG